MPDLQVKSQDLGWIFFLCPTWTRRQITDFCLRDFGTGRAALCVLAAARPGSPASLT